MIYNLLCHQKLYCQPDYQLLLLRQHIFTFFSLFFLIVSHPWKRAALEKRLLDRSITADSKILWICLTEALCFAFAKASRHLTTARSGMLSVGQADCLTSYTPTPVLKITENSYWPSPWKVLCQGRRRQNFPINRFHFLSNSNWWRWSLCSAVESLRHSKGHIGEYVHYHLIGLYCTTFWFIWFPE